MYHNVLGKRVSRARFKEIITAMRNRQELIAAQLSRRDLIKMGLLTSAGYLIPKRGLSARWESPIPDDQPASPPTTPFVEQLPIMPVKQSVASLSPAPTVCPNTAINPATGFPFEGRTRCHQAFTQFPPQVLYQVVQQPGQVTMSPQLPTQTIWGFDGIAPGPTYHQTYGQPILVRNVNNLPLNNGGFGINSVTTHLHNNHTPSESDGFPCDFFAERQYYDQHYPGVLAGFASDHPPHGDINESLSTVWYHDHRVDFTSQNIYKGLAGFFLLFNQFDTGDETTGFHLPSGEFDIPMLFADKVFDPTSGLLFFDTFNLDGILGDKFLVNGKIQPFLHVHPRRYRFRWLDSGPSRFYQIFLTDLNNLSAHNAFWQIANDGNLLPTPVQVKSVRIGVAERVDVIIDFRPFAGKTIYLENRLEQEDGRGPTDNILRAGHGNLLLKIIVDLPTVADNSVDPATRPQFYSLPSATPTPRVTRRFDFDNSNGGWTINDQFMDCNAPRFTVQQNTVEHWILINSSGDWQHPIHIHFEEFQILSVNGHPPAASPLVQTGRKDVVRLEFDTTIELFFRFRDFLGRYPMHCHNTVHEDHAMMLRWDIAPVGDTNRNP